MSTINFIQPFEIGPNLASEQDGAATPTTDDAFSMIGDDSRDDSMSNINEPGRYVKDLFEGEPNCQCCVNWVDELPKNLSLDEEEFKDEAEEEDGNTPLLVRRRRRTHGGTKTWKVHCIEIRNAALRAVLLNVFDDYKFLQLNVKYLTFFSPFRPFYFVWDKFEAAIKEEKDETVLNGLRILKRFVRISLAPDTSVSKELIPNGLITYSCLWMLFKPGDLLYTVINGADAFVRLQSNSSPAQIYYSTMDLMTQYIDWNGDRFGWVDKKITITSFFGTKEITKLDAYPAHLHPNYEQLKKLLIQRGQKFRELAGIHVKTYISRRELDNPDSDKANVNQNFIHIQDSNCTKIGRRIILDAKSYPNQNVHFTSELWHEIASHTNMIQQQPYNLLFSRQSVQHVPLHAKKGPGYQPLLYNLDLSTYNFGVMSGPPPPPPPAGGVLERILQDQGGNNSLSSPSSSPWGRMKNRDRKGHGHPPSQPEDDKSDGINAELTQNELMVCNFEVKGFCLRDRCWRSFDVDRIRDVEWNEEPFNNLVLPKGYKDLILAFVESQLKQNEYFDDVINGKGGGLVILLCGEPGVGKTLTAESVAEKIKARLYNMDVMEDLDDASDSSTYSCKEELVPTSA